MTSADKFHDASLAVKSAQNKKEGVDQSSSKIMEKPDTKVETGTQTQETQGQNEEQQVCVFNSDIRFHTVGL